MNLDLINPYVLKILVAVRDEDSINSISDRISLSYGWTHKWVQELAKEGVFRLTRMKVYLNKNSEFYKKTLKYIKSTLYSDVQFYYEALSLFGIDYCFTKIDAVFVWTKGGYNIARYKNYYPIFIKVKEKDRYLFDYYCKKLSLKINSKKGIFYKPEFLESVELSYCDDMPVDSLDATIDFMQKNKYSFEPALEMIKEMYNKRIKVEYKEVVTNV